MRKKAQAPKLTLQRETLQAMGGTISSGNQSCDDSCYLVSCGGDCDISTGVKQQQQGLNPAG